VSPIYVDQQTGAYSVAIAVWSASERSESPFQNSYLIMSATILFLARIMKKKKKQQQQQQKDGRNPLHLGHCHSPPT